MIVRWYLKVKGVFFMYRFYRSLNMSRKLAFKIAVRYVKTHYFTNKK